MKLNVVNKQLSVGAVKISVISSSSVFLVGDTEVINCSSVYDEAKVTLNKNPGYNDNQSIDEVEQKESNEKL